MSVTKATFGVISIPQVTAANIASATSSVNTSGKYVGLLVWDTTNKRLLRSSGTTATSEWAVVDGSAQVIPS